MIVYCSNRTIRLAFQQIEIILKVFVIWNVFAWEYSVSPTKILSHLLSVKTKIINKRVINNDINGNIGRHFINRVFSSYSMFQDHVQAFMTNNKGLFIICEFFPKVWIKKKIDIFTILVKADGCCIYVFGELRLDRKS